MPQFTINRQHAEPVGASAELVYDVLTDYNTYGEWMPLIAKGHLMAREGDLAIVEFDLTSGAHFTVEGIHTRNRMVLTRPIAGDCPFTKMQWDIQPEDSGKSRVSLAVRLRPNVKMLPSAFGWCKGSVRAFTAHLSAYSADVSVSGPDGEKLLEVMETEDGLVCWMNGKKYVMKESQ
ncbi:MAG: hypothetical protein FJW39_01665 [Acidobacteria bacterium]|nr:hypothetical protein [Acidobacteriota bacterium]